MTWPWSGPDRAGCTAALYAARAGLDVLVLERLGPGGQMAQTQRIENYPGFVDGIDGAAIGCGYEGRCGARGGHFSLADVRSTQLTGRVKELQTDGGPVLARTVVLATGAGPRRLGLPQEDELPGVSYCAACDGAFFRGKDVAVVGGRQFRRQRSPAAVETVPPCVARAPPQHVPGICRRAGGAGKAGQCDILPEQHRNGAAGP